MTKEEIQEMIECRDVYEIVYRKEYSDRIWHIENIRFTSSKLCIIADCLELDKELCFSIEKIVSAKSYWSGILSKDFKVPKDGVYLLVCVYLGQGYDMEYLLRSLRQDDDLAEEYRYCETPIAYHYLTDYNEQANEWIKFELLMNAQEYKEIPAPKSGIPILAYTKKPSLDKQDEHVATNYCLGQSRPDYGIVNYGAKKGEDVSTFFKDPDSYGYTGWSECWEGSYILGLQMIYDYSLSACERHVELRMKNEPNCFY